MDLLPIPPKTVYVICGPTAAGKTAVALELALKLNTDIISADSRQCYKEMIIGTAKPTVEEMKLVKHHFINEFQISTEITAADFESLALQYLFNIFNFSNVAVVCGGTGLYIKALCDGLDDMPQTNKEITIRTEIEYKNNGLKWLQNTIEVEDPGFYKTGEINNPHRMLRALSFIRTTGKSILLYRTNTKKERNFKCIKIGLDLPREVLYNRINCRVDEMMNKGLLNEAEKLFAFKNYKSLQTVGYTELFDFFSGKCKLEESVEKIKQNTRNYAKRQLTWFRKDKEITWFMANDKNIVDKILMLK